MKTRTLMLLALACGVAIMLAGAVFLFQLSGQDTLAPPTPIGELAVVGDMRVTVVGTVESAGVLEVTISVGGVSDSDAFDGFRLIASGRAVSPDESVGGETCDTVTVAEQTCLVRFDVSQADGGSRVMFYERGDDRARWVLA